MLEQARQLLQPELQHVEEELYRPLQHTQGLLREVGEYVLAAPGKRLRPIITLLCARLFSPLDERGIRTAATMELLHNATLLHDDVIDSAEFRRGHQTVNARWGDDLAILLADYFYSFVFHQIVTEFPPEALRYLTLCTSRMCQGEIFQIERRDACINQEDYLRIIRRKTAYLFSACTLLGGWAGKAPSPAMLPLTHFGINFGMAFQITDDNLDFRAADAQWGKGIGSDWQQGKQTLPVIYTLSRCTASQHQLILTNLQDGKELSEIMHLVNEYGGFDYAEEVAWRYVTKAKESLMRLLPSSERQVLADLTEFAVQRSY